ncbi:MULTISPECIES: Rz1-like lysis system protein LysC [Pseudomonadaceae]|uniref:Rz1-like lysis system protein LysC n=1 Tax=Pseudomonas TaxID=286 RepID=UPI002E26E4CD|nr:Rz1-like lysis system protein LysC [Halopseudomonas gallaeciensis]
MKSYAIGLILSCLLLLAGCASDPQSQAPPVIKIGCPAVTPCTLSAAQPQTNGQLLTDTEVIESDWAQCAAKVDAIIEHQEAQHVQTGIPQSAPVGSRAGPAPEP